MQIGLMHFTREEVMDAMVAKSTDELKEEMTGLELMKTEDLRTIQDYILSLSLEDALVDLRWRTGMLNNRANMGQCYSGKTLRSKEQQQ